MLGRSDQPATAAYGSDPPDAPMGDASGQATAYSAETPAYAPGTSPAHARSAPLVTRKNRRVAAGVKVKGGGTLALVGLLTVVIGAWAGIVPYIGPTFGFGATGTPAWRWSLLHSLLWLAPGAAAVLCGLIILAQVPALRNGRGGRGAGLAGFLAFLCGAWLAIGPLAWHVMKTGAVFQSGSAWREFLTRLGYSYGPAVILAMLGGMAMALVVGRRMTGAAMAGEVPAGSSAIPTASSQPF